MSSLTKICNVCGRNITWRKKWEKNWAEIKYCSDSCRKNRNLSDVDVKLESTMLSMLQDRIQTRTSGSPSSIGIMVHDVEHQIDPNGEMNLREKARQAARRLVAKDQVTMVQNGKPVDPSFAKGPIEIRIREDT